MPFPVDKNDGEKIPQWVGFKQYTWLFLLPRKRVWQIQIYRDSQAGARGMAEWPRAQKEHDVKLKKKNVTTSP